MAEPGRHRECGEQPHPQKTDKQNTVAVLKHRTFPMQDSEIPLEQLATLLVQSLRGNPHKSCDTRNVGAGTKSHIPHHSVKDVPLKRVSYKADGETSAGYNSCSSSFSSKISKTSDLGDSDIDFVEDECNIDLSVMEGWGELSLPSCCVPDKTNEITEQKQHVAVGKKKQMGKCGYINHAYNDDKNGDVHIYAKTKPNKNDNISVPYSFQSFMEDAKLATLTGSLKQLDSDDFVQSPGKHFVRSRTVASIPLHQYLTPEAVQDAYKTNQQPVSPVIRTTMAEENDDISGPDNLRNVLLHLPGEIVHTAHRRSRSSERRGRARGRSLQRSHPSCPSWVGTDDDVIMMAPCGPDGRCSPSPGTHYSSRQMASCSGQGGLQEPGRSRLERSSSGRGSFSRLARRLSHKEARRNTDERKKALRQRSVSLDCGDGRRALMTSDHLDVSRREDQSLSIPVSPSLPTRLGRSGNSSPNLAGRLSRRTSSNKSGRRGGSEVDSSSRDRRRRNTADINVLFEAIEQQDMDRVKVILDNNTLDVNCVNEEDLTPLDISLLTNHVPLSRMLLTYGARENPRYQQNPATRDRHLANLVAEAERHLVELTEILLHSSATPAGVPAAQRANERQLEYWDFRSKLRTRMQTGFHHAKPPDAATNVKLVVSSPTSLTVQFDEPLHHNGGVVTRFKVEWSLNEDFVPLVGEEILDDPCYRVYQIPALDQGTPYHVRVTAGNMKGYGTPMLSDPAFATPSSWREVNNQKPRNDGKLQLLEQLFSNIKNTRPADAAQIKVSAVSPNCGTSPLHPRKSNMRKSLKNLFSSAPKFQRTLKRGVYLASLLYCDDRVLVTNEDMLPIVEVDDNFSGTSLNADFHWLMKIACTWEDVKSLRQDMDRGTSSASLHLRVKLLQAAAQMQTAVGVQDLGQFYYQPIRDSSGSVVLATINCVRDGRAVNTTHTKWLPLSKVQRSKPGTTDVSLCAADMLLASITDMVHYRQASSQPLGPGLYLGYLKLKSSVDLIRIMVPQHMPNTLPFVKVRECPNVSREEWDWVKKLSLNEVGEVPTAAQLNFVSSLTSACRTLLAELGITEDEAIGYRLYDMEVVELSEDVSILLVLPPTDIVCSIPGHPDETKERPHYLTLPVQIFEMIHMCTYEYEFISRYSRLSSILETDTHLAQQSQRQAFSTEEMTEAKDRLDQLAQYQQSLDEAWRSMRWTMDIIAYARDKTVRGGLPLGMLYAPPPSPTESPCMDRKEVVSSSNSDVASSSCSDCGYHSDRSSVDVTLDAGAAVAKDKLAKRDSNCSSHSNQEEGEDVWTKVSNQPGILRVYAAYDTGLAQGTSVKLHVTPRTSSRQVINLVVQQLNRAVASRDVNSYAYSDEELQDFCLVAVIGARERVLRDDYQPLLLQNPWTKGRLYVRLKENLLAALEQGQVTSV